MAFDTSDNNGFLDTICGFAWEDTGGIRILACGCTLIEGHAGSHFDERTGRELDRPAKVNVEPVPLTGEPVTYAEAASSSEPVEIFPSLADELRAIATKASGDRKRASVARGAALWADTESRLRLVAGEGKTVFAATYPGQAWQDLSAFLDQAGSYVNAVLYEANGSRGSDNVVVKFDWTAK